MKWHLVENAWLVTGRRGGSWRLLMYVGPALAGAIMLFFLVKPLFARSVRRSNPVAVDPEEEPALFAFIARICDLVQAPHPFRVAVDCQVNASASFDGGLAGLLRRRLVLTIGLPLVAGLSAKQLAGVLAHEFGHFAQGAGMGVTFIIRSVNNWFARVVYERDNWDARLEHWSRNADWRLAVVLWLARSGVWLSRKILYGLMMVGHALSCFMSRQMEFDADYYEAALAGSSSFVSTMRRLPLLALGSEDGYRDLYRSQQTGRIPSNFAALVVARAAALSPEAIGSIHSSQVKPRTSTFDTHPADAERIEHAQRLNYSGVLALDGAACRLFADFDTLAQTASRHHYSIDLGLSIDRLRVLDTRELVEEGYAADCDSRAIPQFFERVLLVTRAVAPPAGGSPMSTHEAAGQLLALRSRIATAIDPARDAARNYSNAEERWDALRGALALIDAGVTIDAEQFGLSTGTRSETSYAIDAALSARAIATPALQELERLQMERLAIALSLAGHPHPASGALLPGNPEHVAFLTGVLRVLVRAWPAVLEARRDFVTWQYLLGNRDAGAESPVFAQAERLGAAHVRSGLQAVLAQVGEYRYPFPHAHPNATIATYLTAGCAEPDLTSDEGLHTGAQERFDRCLRLYFGLLGRLTATALEIENVLVPHAAIVA